MVSLNGVKALISQSAQKNLLPSEWAEKYRYLSKAFTPNPGKVSYDFSPYLREIVDNFSTSSKIQKVSVVKGSRVGASQLILETILGYTIGVAPTSVIYLNENKDSAQDVMQTRIDSMLYTSSLKEKIKPSAQFRHGKKTGNTKSRKEFAGGVIYAKGANAKFIDIGAQIILFDELDKCRPSRFQAGDFVEGWEMRAADFGSRKKIYYGSTPLGDSRIMQIVENGDMRFYFVPCPHCGEKVAFSWRDSITPNGVIKTGKHNFIYEKATDFEVIPESIGYVCNICGAIIKEEHKFNIMLSGVWIPTQEHPKESFHRSYILPQFYSNVVEWKDIVNRWVRSYKYAEKLKIFVNEVCAEKFVEKMELIKSEAVEKANILDYLPYTVPNKLAASLGHGRVVLVTAGIDINRGENQDDFARGYAVINIMGHCADGASFIIAKAHIYGTIDTNGNVWHAITDILSRQIPSDDGLFYLINLCCIDTGYNPSKLISAGQDDAVFDLIAQNWQVRGIKGSNTAYKDGTRFKLTQNERREFYYRLDTTAFKIDLFNRLLLQQTKIKQPPLFMNFPQSRDSGGLEKIGLCENYGVIFEAGGFNDKFYKTFESEIPIYKDVAKTAIANFRKTGGGVNTHDLDAIVYNLAACDIYCCEFAEKVMKVKNADILSVLVFLGKYLEKNNSPI